MTKLLNELRIVLRSLAYSRYSLDKQREKRDKARDALEASDLFAEWEELDQRVRTQKERIANKEADTRLAALDLYGETGDKQIEGGVIGEYDVVAYDDDKAFAYAREHLPKALKLHVPTFKKAAKVLDLDFVNITKEPRFKINSDLSEFKKDFYGEEVKEVEEVGANSFFDEWMEHGVDVKAETVLDDDLDPLQDGSEVE